MRQTFITVKHTMNNTKSYSSRYTVIYWLR